jgi:integrase
VTSTLGDARKVLRSALSHAQTEELITRNVAGLAKLPASRTRKGKAWSTDEARRFLKSARRDGDPLYAAYVLVLVCGLGKGEVLGLTREDLDLDAGELTIGRQLQRVRRELLHRETKTRASDATLPVPAIGVAALRQRLADAEQARPVAGSAWQHTPGSCFARCSARRSTRATSTGPGTPGASRPESGRSPCTTPGGPAARCWPTWTCTPGWR